MLEAQYTLLGLKFTGWTVFGFVFQACFMAQRKSQTERDTHRLLVF